MAHITDEQRLQKVVDDTKRVKAFYAHRREQRFKPRIDKARETRLAKTRSLRVLREQHEIQRKK